MQWPCVIIVLHVNDGLMLFAVLMGPNRWLLQSIIFAPEFWEEAYRVCEQWGI